MTPFHLQSTFRGKGRRQRKSSFLFEGQSRFWHLPESASKSLIVVILSSSKEQAPLQVDHLLLSPDKIITDNQHIIGNCSKLNV